MQLSNYYPSHRYCVYVDIQIIQIYNIVAQQESSITNTHGNQPQTNSLFILLNIPGHTTLVIIIYSKT